MTDIPSLSGPTFGPARGGAPEQIVVLLHGLGADGQDLIGLAPHFAEALPGAVFVSPDAPQPCDMGPPGMNTGRQWFSLREFSAAACDSGTRAAAPVLNAYIDDLLTQYGLDDSALVLSGFSQGTMMALHVGLRRLRPLAGILGYSGMLANEVGLVGDIASHPPVRLIHGQDDPVVPFAALARAEAALRGAGVAVETFARPGLGHGIDEVGIDLGREFLKAVF